MLYLAMLLEDESAYADASYMEDMLRQHNEFQAAAGPAGVLRGGSALEPTATATTIRVRDGERLLTDGPYVETKEQLGGYYLLECADLDEALEWASRIPAAKTGAIELRPVADMAARRRELGLEQTTA
jgi:hypothetical protein